MLTSYFDKEKIIEWEENYIQFSKFEDLLNKFISQDQNEDRIEITNGNLKENFIRKSNIDSISEERIKESANFINSEIKRFYLFYSQIEKELYLLINSRINNKKYYSVMGIKEMFNEVIKLKQIVILNYNTVKYVNLNLFILSCFIEMYTNKINKLEAIEIQKYLLFQLETINSDLNYIYQFKIIDEISLVLDRLIYRIDNIYNTISIIESEKQVSSPISPKSLKSDEEINEKKPYPVVIQDIKDNIRKELKNIKLTIKYIDILSMDYRNSTNDINNFIYFGDKIFINKLTKITETAKRSFLFIGFDDSPNYELINESFIMSQHQDFLSHQIRVNLLAILIHLFLYGMTFSFPISFFIYYFFNNGITINESCYIMAMTPLMNPISNYIGIYLLNKRSYKFVLILSVIILIISSILLGIFNTYRYFIIPFLSRLILGLSSIRAVNRQYILDNTPKSFVKRISYLYQVTSHSGYICGFGLSFIICLFIKDKEYILGSIIISEYSTCCFLISFLLFIFLIYIIISFDEDTKIESFSEMKNNENDDLINTIKTNEISNQQHFLSKEEKKMIEKIDKDLLDVNNNAGFTTTNFLNEEIERIVNFERKGRITIFKAYLILTYCISTFKSGSDFIILFTSIYLIENGWKDIYLWQICLILFLTMLIITPIFSLALNTNNIRLLIFSTIFIMFASISLCIIENYIFLIIIMPFFVGISFYGELFTSKLFMQIIPYEFYIFNTIDSGELLAIISGIGKALTIILFGVSFYINSDIKITSKIIFAYVAIRYLIMLIIVLIKSENLRVKSLTRIMNSFSKNVI